VGQGEGKGNSMHKKITWLAFCLILLVFPFSAGSQQATRLFRIGYLSSSDPATESTRAEAIRVALREGGYVEGQNIAIVYRYAESRAADEVRVRHQSQNGQTTRPDDLAGGAGAGEQVDSIAYLE
jgi:hypothetical protein